MFTLNWICFDVISILLPVLIASCDSSIVRQTKNGPVEGLEQISVLGKKYYSFRGVPYAEVPITGIDPHTGDLVDRRFKATEPLIRKWTEPLKVHDYGDNCIPTTHFFPKFTQSSENCLFVNIFVPAGGAEKKTVIIWIHGGGFTDGSGDDSIYGPDFIIETDSILVTMNYRLGMFGFMNLNFGEYTGNMGLKDQQMALKWIHENIENFSGNNDEILLGGVSAGGASVHYHILNDESRNYFNRAFVVSGAAFDYFALYEPNHLQRLQNFAQIEDKKQLIEYLKTTDSKVLAECFPTKDFGELLVSLPWVPTIESPLAKDAFITKTPEEILMSAEAPAMDILFSFTSEESVLFYPQILDIKEPLLTTDWKESNLTLPFHGFVKSAHPEEYKRAIKLLKDAYLLDTSNVEAIQRVNIGLLSELSINYGLLKSVKLHAKANNKAYCKCNRKNTFVQRFSVNLDINLFKAYAKLNTKGATHAEDLSFLFYCHMLDESKVYDKYLRDKNNENFEMIMRMVKMIANFARNGDPSIEGDTPFMSIKSADEIFVQDITNDAKTNVVTDILQQTHFDTWQEIEKMYNKLKIIPEGNYDYCNAPICNKE